jgi:hypothetical protein
MNHFLILLKILFGILEVDIFHIDNLQFGIRTNIEKRTFKHIFGLKHDGISCTFRYRRGVSYGRLDLCIKGSF